jgi:hypothetical protein
MRSMKRVETEVSYIEIFKKGYMCDVRAIDSGCLIRPKMWSTCCAIERPGDFLVNPSNLIAYWHLATVMNVSAISPRPLFLEPMTP